MRGTRTTVAAVSVAMLAGSALLLSACSGDADRSTGAAAGVQDDSAAAGSAPEPLPEDSLQRGAADSAAGVELGQLSGAEQSQSGANAAPGGGSLADVTVEREIIATAEVTLRSTNVDATVDAIESIATSASGFVSGRDVQNNPDDPDRTRAVVVIRVPTPKLDSVIDRAQEEGDVVRVLSDEQDVTETVIDVNSRVESAKASVERIRALLSEATTLGEVVRIESELAKREADLESLLAQQRALADQTEMATLSVTVLAPEAVETSPKTDPEDEEGFVAGLERGWNALVDLVVIALTTIGLLLPFLAVGLLVLIPLALAWRRRRLGPPAAPPAGPPAAPAA
ncbi:MAG TPA: DUF4349 domain-containing protein [Actinomycetes bacterium]|nr:DUF4349 domain-containing protein [Actinomycetes bacterium]